jgi:hypothetical protein
VVRWLAFLLLLVCFGCSKTVVRLHDAPPAILDPGWLALKSPDNSVSVGIPSSFHSALDKAPADELSLKPATEAPAPDEGGSPGQTAAPSDGQSKEADQALNRFAGDLNGLSASLEESQHEEVVKHMAKEGYVIWAWLNGKSTMGENLTQISIKKTPNVGSMTLDSAVDGAKVGMPGGVTVTNVTLPIGEAKKAYADYQNRIGDEQTEILYVLVDNGDEYVVRFEATNGKELIEPIADSVMQTLRITPKP